ncbi:hypothetical protein [Nocardiopsis sp. Huas11]|uniref:hypothetical protein n=1 Tax=Nocardiopsis sp. Huas11 TaxID=2183912 RepID=UPI0013154C9C|nr:hypothetical protein [Nocardiopsis sp. Huas11]
MAPANSPKSTWPNRLHIDIWSMGNNGMPRSAGISTQPPIRAGPTPIVLLLRALVQS